MVFQTPSDKNHPGSPKFTQGCRPGAPGTPGPNHISSQRATHGDFFCRLIFFWGGCHTFGKTSARPTRLAVQRRCPCTHKCSSDSGLLEKTTWENINITDTTSMSIITITPMRLSTWGRLVVATVATAC